MPRLPGREFVGRALPPRRRAAWRCLAEAVHATSMPGYPLDGWVFHGTSQTRALALAACGMDWSPVLLRVASEINPDVTEQRWLHGTYWATAWIAAFYAEERVVTDGRGDPVLLAVRLADLEAGGQLEVDEQSLDVPVTSRLGKDYHEVCSAWDASDADWKASLRILGSVACLGAPSAGHVRCLKDMDDLNALILAACSMPQGPARR